VTGDGLTTAGRVLPFEFGALRLLLFTSPGRFEFVFLFAFELLFAFLLALFEFALRLSFALSFLLTGFRLGLFSLAVVDSFEFWFSVFSSGFFSGGAITASDDSPSLASRLISIATV
jgi:hypothetical protein